MIYLIFCALLYCCSSANQDVDLAGKRIEHIGSKNESLIFVAKEKVKIDGKSSYSYDGSFYELLDNKRFKVVGKYEESLIPVFINKEITVFKRGSDIVIKKKDGSLLDVKYQGKPFKFSASDKGDKVVFNDFDNDSRIMVIDVNTENIKATNFTGQNMNVVNNTLYYTFSSLGYSHTSLYRTFLNDLSTTEKVLDKICLEGFKAISSDKFACDLLIEGACKKAIFDVQSGKFSLVQDEMVNDNSRNFFVGGLNNGRIVFYEPEGLTIKYIHLPKSYDFAYEYH